MKEALKVIGAGTLIVSAIIGGVLLFLVGGHLVLGLILFGVPNVIGLGALAVK
jgi:hypothetical protein